MRTIFFILSYLIPFVYVANADIPFQPVREYEVGANSTGLKIADLDGDGDPDIVVSNRTTHDVAIMKNNGDGLFLERSNFLTGLNPRYVDGADFDGDGDIDLCTPDYGSWTTTVLENDGTGVFEILSQQEFRSPAYLWTADIDLDGNQDILNLHWDGDSKVPSQSPGKFTPMFGNGDGTFEIINSFQIGTQPRCGASADFNNDGFTDIVTANYADFSLSLLMGSAAREWSEEVVLKLPGLPRYLAAEDLDKDGDVDIALVDKAFDQLMILKNDGKGNFELKFISPTNFNPHSLSLGDVNNDDHIDIIVTHVGSGNQIIYFNNGMGFFIDQQTVFISNGPAEVRFADFSNDGLLDIATANVNDFRPGLSILLQGQCQGPDCNSNGIGDFCDLPDCNSNGVPDECDIFDGFSLDIDGNGIPDECDIDCNLNEIPDWYEIATGVTTDCNDNLIPDDCDWIVLNDCDNNGVLDGCESDINHDLIPDSCQCIADFDFNLIVDVNDLLVFISHWGDEPNHDASVADFNGDLEVGVDDLLIFIEMWGECPETAQTHLTGACCLDLICIENRAELACYILNGEWMGDGVECDATDCENP